MATLKRPSKDKDIVGRFMPDGRCKKHPKHRQSPGVCSLCLNDKLSQLSSSSSSSSSSRKTTSTSSSSSSSLSSYYSSSASSCASPTHDPFPFPNEAKSGSSASIFLLRGGLVKSRSMAVVPRRKEGEGGVGDEDDCNNKSVKKSGFLFKLLHPKSKRMEEKGSKLIHTRSLIETVT
ncbi:protein AF-9-like [Abrus precatorius]|uniref:Protein AF-9-like n=1 Tax=Abrus precatorius TaxID=3816 RepID=A0A8B8K8D2_ABRPR|nr:protein AF-9-like [Abrus precatorius]